MADADCKHPDLRPLDPGQHRGWVCADCGASGPTVVTAEIVESQYGKVLAVRMLCVCGSGWEWPWPAAATGTALAAKLAEHADCKPQ